MTSFLGNLIFEYETLL